MHGDGTAQSFPATCRACHVTAPVGPPDRQDVSGQCPSSHGMVLTYLYDDYTFQYCVQYCKIVFNFSDECITFVCFKRYDVYSACTHS